MNDQVIYRSIGQNTGDSLIDSADEEKKNLILNWKFYHETDITHKIMNFLCLDQVLSTLKKKDYKNN